MIKPSAKTWCHSDRSLICRHIGKEGSSFQYLTPSLTADNDEWGSSSHKAAPLSHRGRCWCCHGKGWMCVKTTVVCSTALTLLILRASSLCLFLRPYCLFSWKGANHLHSDHAGAIQPQNTCIEKLYAFLKFLLCFIKYLFPSGPHWDCHICLLDICDTITGFPVPIYTHFKTVKQHIFSLSKSVSFQPYNRYVHIVLFCCCLFLWPFICALMFEGNQVFSNLGIIQREINVNPQSMLPGLVPRIIIIMLSGPWESEARFWVSNWSTADMRQKSATLKFVCWF